MHVQCSACGKIWRCITGNGLSYANKENIIQAFSQGERQRVTGLLASSEIPAYDFQYRLSVCGHCRNVVSVPALGLSETEEPYVGVCPLCGGRTGESCAGEEIGAWSKKTACPVCGSMALRAEEAGCWD